MHIGLESMCLTLQIRFYKTNIQRTWNKKKKKKRSNPKLHNKQQATFMWNLLFGVSPVNVVVNGKSVTYKQPSLKSWLITTVRDKSPALSIRLRRPSMHFYYAMPALRWCGQIKFYNATIGPPRPQCLVERAGGHLQRRLSKRACRQRLDTATLSRHTMWQCETASACSYRGQQPGQVLIHFWK